MRDLPIARLLMQVRTLGRCPLSDPERSIIAALPPGALARRDDELLLGMLSPVSMRTPIRTDTSLQPLRTEKRVLATGPRAKRTFTLHSRLVGGGSSLIRHELLLAVARRAEAEVARRG